MKDVLLFLSLEHLEAIVGLLIGLISIFLCLRRPEERERGREWPGGGAVRTHNSYQLNLPSSVDVVCGAPKQLQW